MMRVREARALIPDWGVVWKATKRSTRVRYFYARREVRAFVRSLGGKEHLVFRGYWERST